MNFWEEIISNKVLIAAILGWCIAQILKVIYILITERRFDIERIVGSGGMPSSHSAFVSAMTTAVGFEEGFGSSFFAIAFVLSFIVMYDASGVRKAAGEQAKVINDLQEMLHKEVPVYLKELLGHTRLEVIVGSLLGIAIGLLMFL
jgi:acid phosphatase family membrane protein YuiD